jgi:hypothetical protein
MRYHDDRIEDSDEEGSWRQQAKPTSRRSVRVRFAGQFRATGAPAWETAWDHARRLKSTTQQARWSLAGVTMRVQ